MPENLILDTCALIWLVSDDKKLSTHAREEIDAATVVYVSAISAWEVSFKTAKGQLKLPLPPLEWFRRSLDAHYLSLAPLSPEVLTRANELPWHHHDPADRFIIATATIDSLCVVTADKRFTKYGVPVLR